MTNGQGDPQKPKTIRKRVDMASINRNSAQRDTVSVWQRPIDVDGANAPEVAIERAFLPDECEPIRHGSPINGRLSLTQADGTALLR